MKDFELVQVESRAELRRWLEANHARKESIFLVTYKKNVPEKYVRYDDIVEEALCFGWIDGLTRKLDAERSMLLLSPRRPGSGWSSLNKRRIEKLLAEGLIMPPGLAAIERAKQDGSWSVYDEVDNLVIPEDLAVALSENETAATYFQAFSNSSKRGILWWIKSAKTPATRQRRIADTVRLAQHNLRASFPEGRLFDRKNK